MTAWIGAIIGLIGVLVGGGIRATEVWWARRKEAEALLSALVAEVEALTRLMNHRRFVDSLTETGKAAALQVQNGRGAEPAIFAVISLKHDYFAVFNASAAKIGILLPYHADRITRFYTYAKAVQENYDPSSPFQTGVTAEAVVGIIENDLFLLHTAMILGNHIATFRKVVPPSGIADPFFETNVQPALPRPSTEQILSSAVSPE